MLFFLNFLKVGSIMKKRFICAVAIALFLMVFVTAVHAESQYFINEDELETRFAENSEALLTSLKANTTVVVPAPEDHECRFMILWKKVTYENGQPVQGAAVTLDSSYAGTKVRKGPFWWEDLPVTKITNKFGSVFFIILWNHHPPPSIEVTLTVSKDGYTHTETVTLTGNFWCYNFKCIHNTIHPPPGAPELELATPIVTSIGAATYFWFRRKREKQTYGS